MRAIPVASGTAGVQAITGAGVLLGYTYNVSAAGAAGTVQYVRDGTDNTGAKLAIIPVGATGGVMVAQIPAIPFTAGLFVDKVTGTSELVLYVM
jgi:hypothetical protein